MGYSETNGDTKIDPKDTPLVDSEGYAHLITNKRRDDETVDTYDHVTSNGGIADDTQNLLEKEQNGIVSQQEADAEVYTSPRGDENNSTETKDNSGNVEDSNDAAEEIKKENG